MTRVYLCSLTHLWQVVSQTNVYSAGFCQKRKKKKRNLTVPNDSDLLHLPRRNMVQQSTAGALMKIYCTLLTVLNQIKIFEIFNQRSILIVRRMIKLILNGLLLNIVLPCLLFIQGLFSVPITFLLYRRK